MHAAARSIINRSYINRSYTPNGLEYALRKERTHSRTAFAVAAAAFTLLAVAYQKEYGKLLKAAAGAVGTLMTVAWMRAEWKTDQLIRKISTLDLSGEASSVGQRGDSTRRYTSPPFGGIQGTSRTYMPGDQAFIELRSSERSASGGSMDSNRRGDAAAFRGEGAGRRDFEEGSTMTEDFPPVRRIGEEGLDDDDSFSRSASGERGGSAGIAAAASRGRGVGRRGDLVDGAARAFDEWVVDNPAEEVRL